MKPAAPLQRHQASMNIRLATVTTILVLFLGSIRFVICEQFFPDAITTKSGETIEGRITAESGGSVTVSIETSAGHSDRVISKSDIDHIFRGAPGERPPPKPVKLEQLNAPSPDKKWDYVNRYPPELLNANTSETALTSPYDAFSAPFGHPIPDVSQSIMYGGELVLVSIYELSGGEWKELTTLGNEEDQTLVEAAKNITAQLKAKGLPENISLRLIRQSIQLHN